MSRVEYQTKLRESDDGSASLEQFITDNNYTRTTLKSICESDHDELNVIIFIHNKGIWTELLEEDVYSIWGVDTLTKEAFCKGIDRNVFKLAKPHLITLKRALDKPQTPDVIGLYTNDENTYLLVVRVPVSYKLTKLAAGLGGGLIGVLGTGLGARKDVNDARKLNADNDIM
jgi:hypothetical protein